MTMSSSTSRQLDSPERRPLLIFNHNAKAGGRSILEILKEAKAATNKNVVKVYNPFGMKKAMIHKNSLMLLEDPHSLDHTLVYILEKSQTRLKERQAGFVIGSAREPCAQYLSKWIDVSSNHGQEFYWNNQHLIPFYGLDAPFYNSTADIQRFYNWMRQPMMVGYMAQQQFVRSYGNHLEGVDCLVLVEAFEESLVDCLERYEHQGGYVNWNHAKLKALVDVATHKKNNKDDRLMVSSPNNSPNLFGNLQDTHHAPCDTYFTPALGHRVESGLDKYAYTTLGYQGCCDEISGASTRYTTVNDMLTGRQTTSKPEVPPKETTKETTTTLETIQQKKHKKGPMVHKKENPSFLHKEKKPLVPNAGKSLVDPTASRLMVRKDVWGGAVVVLVLVLLVGWRRYNRVQQFPRDEGIELYGKYSNVPVSEDEQDDGDEPDDIDQEDPNEEEEDS